MGECKVRGLSRRSRAYTGAHAGAGAAAAVAVAALALSGCSSDSGKPAAKQSTASATTASPSTTAVAGGTSVPTASGSADSGGTATQSTRTVEGIWLATQNGGKVQLVLGKGKAGLTSTHLCGGAYTGKNPIVIVLTCMDGDKERTSGHGSMAADGKTLTVQWSGGTTDTFSRTGLPSN